MEIVHWITRFIVDGGVFMYIILLIWAIAVGVGLERFKALFSTYDVDGPSFMNELQRYILSNDIQGAIRVCSGSEAALPRVLKSGLKRATQSSEQVQHAIDATALEMIPKIEKRLGFLSFAANLSTLFGLLGTVHGLTVAFSGVGAVDPSQKGELLAKGIAIAMNTTALGLSAAITIMMVHAFLLSKSDKIVAEIDEYSVKLQDLLGTKKALDD